MVYVVPATQYMFTALRDCVPAIKWSRHHETSAVPLEQFDKQVSFTDHTPLMYMYTNLTGAGQTIHVPSLDPLSQSDNRMYVKSLLGPLTCSLPRRIFMRMRLSVHERGSRLARLAYPLLIRANKLGSPGITNTH